MADPTSALAVVAARLNAASDRLAQKVLEEEASLALGIEAWVPLDDKKQFHLGYTKDVKWHLHLVQEVDGVKKDWPLSSAPRHLRLYALKHVPKLREAILKDATLLAVHIERFLDGKDEDKSDA